MAEDGKNGGVDKLARNAADALERADRERRFVRAARSLRRMLPGDPELGDPLSTSGERAPHVLARQLSERAPDESLTRELGMGALQVWQAFSEARGRGRGKEELVIVFTDLVDFSSWALEAGDEAAVRLLREVARSVEPPITQRRGRIVKRLGDGMMAVFDEASPALDAVVEAREHLAEVAADGYKPQIRAGIHVGRPRCVGGDYLGVDVNVAARLAEEASGDEILVSDRTLDALGDGSLKSRRKRRLKVKGVPRDLGVFTVEPG